MEELVSIIIPAYNAERWISETIRSALSQTWSKKEIIIVDDGSTDGTLAIAKSFESTHVKVLAQENKGVSAARNTGLRLAQGHYIQWLDADDLLAPDKIMNQLNYAECGKNGRTLLTSSFGTFYYCHNRAKVSPTRLWQDLSPVDWVLNKFNEKVWMNPATWLVSRNLTEKVGPWNERLVRDNDGEYICRVVVASEKVRFVSKAMSYYRVCNIGSLSNSLSDKVCESMALSLSLCFEYLLSLENSDRARSACLSYLQFFMPMFYPEKEEILVKLHALASQLGGQLSVPEMNWKYAVFKRVAGAKAAKSIMIRSARMKHRVISNFDRILCGIMHKVH